MLNQIKYLQHDNSNLALLIEESLIPLGFFTTPILLLTMRPKSNKSRVIVALFIRKPLCTQTGQGITEPVHTYVEFQRNRITPWVWNHWIHWFFGGSYWLGGV